MNRLEERNLDGSGEHQGWNALLREWGALNGLKVSRALFGPRKLSGLKVRTWPMGRGAPDDAWESWPGRDHVTLFQRNRKPAAIVTEPYGGAGNPRAYIEPLGLKVHQPPNPYASFWYPGWTLFFVITKPDFGEVRWLPEQLAYEGRPPE